MSDVSETEEENGLQEKPKKQQYTNATRDISNRPKKHKTEKSLEDNLKSDEEFEYESDEEYYQKLMTQTEDEEDDLKRQLRLEKEEAERIAKEGEKNTRRDPDGTEYEWDPKIKGWFPVFSDRQLIDYQQNYGVQAQNAPAAAAQTVSQLNTKLLENTFYLFNGSFFKWDFKENKWIAADTPVYAYVDYLTGISYEWNQEANQWQAKDQKNTSVKSSENSQTEKNVNKEKKKREGWFEMEDEKNTNVYVSGLPLDTTDEEFEELMSKYGIIMKDPLTHKLKIKLYKDENEEVKGDGRCCYLMPESVKLCLQLMDESVYRDHKIHVEKAKFEQKGTFDPSKAKTLTDSQKKKLSKAKEKKLLEKQRQKLLDWEERPEIVRQKHEKVVVIKNIFSPSDFEKKNRSLLTKFRDDLRAELEVYGDVKKIIVHERNPEGVVTVSFKDVEMADSCCEYLNNRVWKNGRIITCETWDGETKYEIEETDEERERRLAEWHQFLEEEEEDDEN